MFLCFIDKSYSELGELFRLVGGMFTWMAQRYRTDGQFGRQDGEEGVLQGNCGCYPRIFEVDLPAQEPCNGGVPTK